MADVQLGPLMQINMPVKEIEPAIAFYRDTLGLPFLFQAGNLAFFDCGGVRLLVDVAESEEFAHPGSVLYFRVEDIHAASRALDHKGVEIVSAPHLIHRHEDGTEEWMAFFNDPEGRPLALMASAAAPN